jgi:hypothetical protein
MAKNKYKYLNTGSFILIKGYNPRYNLINDNEILLEFHDGFNCKVNGKFKKKFQTNIKFICNPEIGIGVPEILPLEHGKCEINYKWESSLTCHNCDNKDFDYTETECIEGKKTIINFFKNPKNCFKGKELPRDIIKDCTICESKHTEFIDTSCINGFITRKYIWKEPKICTSSVIIFINKRTQHIKYLLHKF